MSLVYSYFFYLYFPFQFNSGCHGHWDKGRSDAWDDAEPEICFWVLISIFQVPILFGDIFLACLSN